MDMRFSTTHILQIAESVEQREIDYYARAAQHIEAEELRDVCRQLAGWSLRHKRAWAQRRQRIAPDTETSQACLLPDPAAMAGLTWFGLRVVPDKRFKSWTCRETVLWEAMQRAKDLVTFYEGLKGFAGDAEALLMIDRILNEEDRHLQYIQWLMNQPQTIARSA